MKQAHKSPAGLVWCGPIFDPSGYADEGRGLVCALDAEGVDVALRPVHRVAPGFREGLPAGERATLDRQVARSRSAEGVLVQHHTADAFFQMDGPLHHVGRTMFETDGIPPSWVHHCNQMDELWLPSAFNIDTFRGAGVHVPIVRVPGGIDSQQFHPGVRPMDVAGLRGTVFLAVFEWRLRKGWDVLLRAWAEAFGPDDQVTLVLRTYPIDKSAGTDNETVINQRIDAFLETECHRRRTDVAPIVVLGRTVPGAQMPALYRVASALVAPTRGEGWGRPFMEAMASGLPVIATNWSAHLEFMHNENSLLLDVDRLEQADGVEVPLYRGQRWAMPSATHLATLMRRVHEQPGEAKAIGARARQDMENEWPWRQAATIIADRIRALRGREGLVAVQTGARSNGPCLAVQGHFFDTRAGDQDAERVVSALVRAWPHTVHVRSGAPSRRRPSAGSPIMSAWRATQGPDGGQKTTEYPPDVELTWLDASVSDSPHRPAAARWIVCTGEAVSRSVPGFLARVLRDEADDVWVPSSSAWTACRAIGVPEERLWRMPPLPPAAHIMPHGARAELPQSAETVFLLPALDAGQADHVEALLRLWQRVFDANRPVLLLVYAPDLGIASLAAWHERLISLLSSGRLLHGAPIQVIRDRLVGDELTALVRTCDVVLDPLPSAATAAMRRMADGCGRRTLTGSAPQRGDSFDSFDPGAWRLALQSATASEAAPHSSAATQATATAMVSPSTEARGAHSADASTGPGASEMNELASLGAAAVARLQAVIASTGRNRRTGSVEHLAPWPIPEARACTVLAHVDWHDGTGGGVLRSYLDAFDSTDDVTLVLCLDPAQGVSVEDVQRIVLDAAESSGRGGDSAADIVLIPELLTDQLRGRLLARCSAVVALGHSPLAEWAASNGRQVVRGLSTAAWRGAVGAQGGVAGAEARPAEALLRAG